MLRNVAKPLAETVAAAASAAAKTPATTGGSGAAQAATQAAAAGACDHLGALAAMSQQRRRVSILTQPTEVVPSKKKDVDVQVVMGGHAWLETTAKEQACGAPKTVSAVGQKGAKPIESIGLKASFPSGERFEVKGNRLPMADVHQAYESPRPSVPTRRTDLGEMSAKQSRALRQFTEAINQSPNTTYFVAGQGAHPDTMNCVDLSQAALQHVGKLDPNLPPPPLGTRPQDLHDLIDAQYAQRGTDKT
jgi:hypothetical protein